MELGNRGLFTLLSTTAPTATCPRYGSPLASALISLARSIKSSWFHGSCGFLGGSLGFGGGCCGFGGSSGAGGARRESRSTSTDTVAAASRCCRQINCRRQHFLPLTQVAISCGLVNCRLRKLCPGRGNDLFHHRLTSGNFQF